MHQEDGSSDSTSEYYCCSNPNCKSVFSQPKIIMYRVCPACQTMIDTTAAVFQAGVVVEAEPEPVEQTNATENLEKPEQVQSKEPRAIAQSKTVEAKTLEPETIPPTKKAQPTTAEPCVTEAKKTETKTMAQPDTTEPKKAEPRTAEPKTRLSQKILEPKMALPKKIEPKTTAQPETIERKTAESKTILPPTITVQPRIAENKTVEPKTNAKSAVKSEVDNASSGKTCQYYFGYLGQREKGEGIPSSCIECAKSLDCMLAEYYKSKETVEEIRKWYHPKL